MQPYQEPAPSAGEPRVQAPRGRMPQQIFFIIGNEACERFSFYGMRNILTMFLTGWLLVGLPKPEAEAGAKEVFHLFVMGVYFFPLLGGWLSDRLLGKYRTIFWLSLLYCAGQACLAFFVDSKEGFYTGLFLIALGSGGIKPCVSTFVGDQFDQTNRHLAQVVFDAFYWIINFGSFFASLLIPLTLRAYGPRVAFGIPGALMAAATVVLWVGRARYVHVPPTPADEHGFVAICRDAIFARGAGSRVLGYVIVALGVAGAIGAGVYVEALGAVGAICLGLVSITAGFGVAAALQLERAAPRHGPDDIDGVRSVLRVLVLFALVTPFWSLFDQKASTWVLQAGAMKLPAWSWFTSASQMQAVNPLLVMLLIPFNNLVLYPLLRALGVEPTPLRRMSAGIAFSGLAWIAVGAMQLALDRGHALLIVWQLVPYALLTFGEVLVSATGLEFAYSQAPVKLKGVLMSCWMLSTTIGNLWVIVVNQIVRRPSVTRAIEERGYGVAASQMFFFAGFAFVAAAAFALYARRYRMVDHYRKA